MIFQYVIQNKGKKLLQLYQNNVVKPVILSNFMFRFLSNIHFAQQKNGSILSGFIRFCFSLCIED